MKMANVSGVALGMERMRVSVSATVWWPPTLSPACTQR